MQRMGGIRPQSNKPGAGNLDPGSPPAAVHSSTEGDWAEVAVQEKGEKKKAAPAEAAGPNDEVDEV